MQFSRGLRLPHFRLCVVCCSNSAAEITVLEATRDRLFFRGGALLYAASPQTIQRAPMAREIQRHRQNTTQELMIRLHSSRRQKTCNSVAIIQWSLYSRQALFPGVGVRRSTLAAGGSQGMCASMARERKRPLRPESRTKQPTRYTAAGLVEKTCNTVVTRSVKDATIQTCIIPVHT